MTSFRDTRRRHESSARRGLVAARSAHAARVDLRQAGHHLDGAERGQAGVDVLMPLLGEREDLEPPTHELARDLLPLAEAVARQAGLGQLIWPPRSPRPRLNVGWRAGSSGSVTRAGLVWRLG